MSKIDFGDRRFDGELRGEEFSVYADGTLSCRKSASTVLRDEMRLAAADAFLNSRKALRLSFEERNYWTKIQAYDREHRSLHRDKTEVKAA